MNETQPRRRIRDQVADKVRETYETPYGQALLYRMQQRDRHVYAGTVPQHVIDRRRAANKRARASRRINRRRG